jgi:hypothetical protein
MIRANEANTKKFSESDCQPWFAENVEPTASVPSVVSHREAMWAEATLH